MCALSVFHDTIWCFLYVYQNVKWIKKGSAIVKVRLLENSCRKENIILELWKFKYSDFMFDPY